MNCRKNFQDNHASSGSAAWVRRAGTVTAVLGLSLTAALGVFAAPTNETTAATAYSWPGFHAGGTTDPTATSTGVLAPYYQLQGTPSGIYQPGGTGTNYYPTQINSTILGNYNPAQPPLGVTGTSVSYFPNHFSDGPLFSPHYRQITGPLGFLQPSTGSTADVQSSPTAVNATEYPDIANMRYYGEQAVGTTGTGVSGAPDSVQHGGGTTDSLHKIRQVVYYGRTETVTALSNGAGGVTVGGVPVPSTAGIPAGSRINVGAIYAMDGFTGGVIWRYQTPSFNANSVVSATTQFTANLNGTADFNTTVSPQPFQIGPTANPTATSPEGSTSPPLATAPGAAATFALTNPNLNARPAGLPAGNLNISLYANTATTTSVIVPLTGGGTNTDAGTLYTGTFRIYQINGQNPAATAANNGNILAHGNFSLTVDNTTTAVTGQFTVDAGTLQPSYATGPVNLAAVSPIQVAAGSTFSATSGALNLNLQSTLGGTLQDASVFTSVSVAKINVATTVGGTPASKLVVIAGDNNGYVYCLDAVGLGDGASNSNIVVNTTANPLQIAYTSTDQAAVGVSAHLGTTTPLWIYRPDPAHPHLASGAVDPAPSVSHDLPVPRAFNSASPTVYVDPTATVTGTPNATVYIGNSNGVLYALDATGGVDPANAAFNAARTGLPGIANTVPTCNPKWWYAVPGVNADTSADTTAIESAPAVYAALPPTTFTTGPTSGGGTTDPVVYFGTSDSSGNNVGRLYAVDGLTGPTGPGGATITPGVGNYNISQQGRWTFPSSAAGSFRNPLGDISGSPVVFQADGVTPVIYFAANTGDEYLNGAVVPAGPDTGRLWGVNADGTYHFSYPNAGDPNSAAGTFTPTGNAAPMEGFLHTTPAIGWVQFPTAIQYLNTAGTAQSYTVTPNPTPMLYAGTTGTNGGYLYGIDIDPAAASTSGGVTTTGADVFRVPCPNGASFVSSPVLVTNASTAGGNGGAVFVCTSAGQLLQYQATPTSTASTSANYPAPRVDYTFPVGGPISAPAVAAATVSDVLTSTPTVTFNGGSSVTDWVYVGDANTGQCWGFTPRGFGTDTTGDYLPDIIPATPPALNLPPVVNQFPLRAFLFDSTSSSLRMDNAFGYGRYAPSGTAPTAGNHSALPVFEWGQSVGVRIANVVPPGVPDPALHNFIKITGADDGAGGTTDYYLGNGGPIQYLVADVTTAGSRTVINNVGVTLSIPNAITTNPSLNSGFFERGDYGTLASSFGPSSELIDGVTAAPTTAPAPTDYRAFATELLDPNNLGWVAAGAYSIGAGTALDALGQLHPNTPGSRRQIISASQTYTLYTSSDGGTTAAGFAPAVTAATATTNAPQETLTLSASPAYSYTNGGGDYPGASTAAGSGTIVVDQPTFGILNPLAIRAAGIDLTATTVATQVAQTWVDSNSQEGVGPFRALPTATLTTGASLVDLAALANGNYVLTNPPASGVLGDKADPTAGTSALNTFTTNYGGYFRYVITTTGQIGHGTTGDNSDPAPAGAPAPQSGTTGNLNGEPYGPYLFNVADRSALGLTGGSLNVAVQSSKLQWNDNSNLSAGTGVGSIAACINPLPWETPPVPRQNSSRDYPDIPAAAVAFGLTSPLPAAAASGTGRTVFPQSTQVSIAVPKYQPANLQLAKRSGTAAPVGIVPTATIFTDGAYHFPMGYVSRQRITATTGPTNTTSAPSNTQNQGEAYRVVYVYTGVPVDLSTSIQNNVTDIGTVPHGFGVQMNAYTPDGAAFTPYNLYPGFAGHFQQLTIHNDGNTNLINPHLDQKLAPYNTATNTLGTVSALPLLSDALDTGSNVPLSYIPAYDNGNVSGELGTVNSAFLVRSSLDTDLQALGANHGATGALPNYNGVTFHKPRVGDTQGTTMTIPDVPHDNDYPYTLNRVSGQLTINAAGRLVDATGTLSTTAPYVSVAVPLGTPVGNYSSNLQLFEDYDPNYSALLGPTYTPGADVLALALDGTGQPHGVQPTSRPGTQLLVHVAEDRQTDGFTRGALPMIDAVPTTNLATTAQTGAADFAPAAYRDPVSGSLSLYWVSSRNYNPATPTPPYTIFGSNLTFNASASPYYTETSASPGHFTPAASGQSWWTSPTAIPNTTTTGVGFSVALNQNQNTGIPDGNNPFGFVTTITGSGAATQYAITCNELTSGTGVPNGTNALVVSSTQPKSGVHGLAIANVSFPDAAPGSAQTIGNNLWAFWNGGTRGRTALYYGSSTATSQGIGAFTTPAALPIPAGLVSVADATPTSVLAPDTTSATNTAVPAIEVTYSGVNAAGNADVYISRYRPYFYTPTGATSASVLLGLMRMPQITEQLQADPLSRWYQARDVGWARNGGLQITLGVSNGATSALYTYSVNGTTVTENLNGAGAAPVAKAQAVYDRASGILALANVDLPTLNGATVSTPSVGTPAGQTIFVDLASGRIRFSQPLPSGAVAGVNVTTSVTVTFNPTARRLTTGPAADTAPTAFLDTADKANASGVSTDPNIEADRYWVFWHKDAVGKTNPSLWYKTQRLTFSLTNAGQPIPIPLNANGQPNVIVTVNGTQVYAPGNTGNSADVDAARGRIYFPIVVNGAGTEGQTVIVNGTTYTNAIHWLDEPRYNDTSNQNTPGALDAAAGDGALVPLNTITNESGVTAFLDPAAYANPAGVATSQVPHKVWLFWTSTRNGTADIYYETINPRFSAGGQ